MNMRDFWANEAAAMRDTSGVLGKEVLKPVSTNSAPKKIEENFRTGYWLEGNTIVFSCYVYDKYSLGRDKIDIVMQAAVKIRVGLKFKYNGIEYAFRLDFKILDKPKYDINYVKTLDKLEDFFYMEFVAGTGTGVTHFNPDCPTKSAYFQIKVGDLMKYGSVDEFTKLEVSRVITHESFHPLIDHPWTFKSMNPLEDTIWTPIQNEIMKFRDLDNLEQGKKNAVASLKAKFSKEIKVFTDNIMLSPEMLNPKTDINAYRAECIYKALDIDIWKNPNIMNKGREIHYLQLEKILNQLK
jgi:hypothetical protein